MADKEKPKEEKQTPLEWLRSRVDYEYVRHQPQHKKDNG